MRDKENDDGVDGSRIHSRSRSLCTAGNACVSAVPQVRQRLCLRATTVVASLALYSEIISLPAFALFWYGIMKVANVGKKIKKR